MEEEKLEMGMFGQDFELNFDFDNPNPFIQENENEEDDDLENEDPLKNTNDTIEDEDPEEVDSEDDDPVEGDDDENEDDSSSSSNLFSSLANVLHEQGLLPSLDLKSEKIENVEDFTNAFRKELDVQAQLKLDDYIANMDLEAVARSNQNLQNLNTITEDYLKENIEVAKNIIYNDYLNQGLDEQKASKLLNRIVRDGEEAILEESLDSLESLKAFEQRSVELEKENYQKQMEENAAAQLKFEEDLKKVIFDKQDLITGFKPTKALSDKVYKTINDIVGKAPDGQLENKFMRDRRMNPMEFEARMYYFYELTNGFTDYSKLTTKAKSSAIKDLEKAARKQTTKDNGIPLWSQDANSYGAFGSELNI